MTTREGLRDVAVRAQSAPNLPTLFWRRSPHVDRESCFEPSRAPHHEFRPAPAAGGALPRCRGRHVFCPGGINNINELYNINVGQAVIEDLEKRARGWKTHQRSMEISVAKAM